MVCDFNKAKQCDGLCNNCGRNYSPSENPFAKIVPSRMNLYEYNDYEGAILARQEMENF